MSLLQAARVGYQYSLLEPLFHDVTFDIDPGDRIALVGPNGAGKTTLLRILAGDLEPDQGTLARRRGLRVAVLNQVQDQGDGGASAGQRTQEALARCMASDADLLLLDEPTNHLDLRARRWLARELATLTAACVVVSHDRAFLDDVATRVFEIERGAFTAYNGGYAWYEREREMREAAHRASYESQQRRFAALDRAAERRSRLAVKVGTRPEGQRDARGGTPFYGAKAGRVARTARLIRERKSDEPKVDKPWESAAIPALTFTNVPRASDPPVELIGVSKAYDGRPVFRDLHLQCRRGDRWGLTGPNGCGKTTLFRLLLGRETPDSGEIRIAPNVRFGYYAQEAENLDPRKSAVEICGEVCADGQWIRTLLACLKLPRALADQPAGQLSPGERAKVGLARVLVEGANVLLLDEPTNHLEVEAQEALEATLRDYPGTILLVSHDRRFIERFAGRVFEFTS